MTERTYYQEEEAGTNEYDPVAVKRQQLEAEIMAGDKAIDPFIITKALQTQVTLDGISASAGDLIQKPHEEFVGIVECALELRRTFYDGLNPHQTTTEITEEKITTERLSALAYRSILDDARGGLYNGTKDIMQGKAEFHLASLLSSANVCQETLAKITPPSLAPEGDIFTGGSRNGDL